VAFSNTYLNSPRPVEHTIANTRGGFEEKGYDFNLGAIGVAFAIPETGDIEISMALTRFNQEVNETYDDSKRFAGYQLPVRRQFPARRTWLSTI